MKLPIDVCPNPPTRFKWQQVVTSPIGTHVVDHEGALPPTVETAVLNLITLAKRLLEENEGLRKQMNGLAERVAAQSELLSKRAESLQQTGPPQRHKR